MKELLDKYFSTHTQQLVDDISTLVAIPSVRGEAQDGMPFGEMSCKALEAALSMAEGYGFATKNYDNYVGAVDFNNAETEMNIFAHLDVVAAGDGWHTDPFTVVEKDGVLYGRGVSDDKGPALAALYAMRALKESGVSLSKNVRLVLGTNEECGSSDLKYYFTKEKAAPWSITPDANFPVTNGEKGGFSKEFTCEYKDNCPEKYVKSINGGVAGNAVPAVCEAEVVGIDDETLLAFSKKAEAETKAQFEISGGKILCKGTSAHASLPFMGNNPITAMVAFLSSLPLSACESTEKIKALSVLFPHGDWLGKSFGVEMEDILGELTLTLDILNLSDGKIKGYFDSRTPMKANNENCADIIAGKLNEKGFFLKNNNMKPPHYVDENSSFIQTLLKNYEEFTGDKGECISMGGGTYVHNIDGGVAFGAIKRGLNTNMHGADEFMPVEDLITAAKVYAGVIYDMCK
ncbi:MAG: Sapep family Mn(2+)-dependent dipeptidase [Clostridia bacterium]|nr:Sapep family Mn(2+)-dependent dipeptidase [Clostridia bacterium]